MNALDDPIYNLMHRNMMKHLADTIMEMPHDDYHDRLAGALVRAEETRDVVGDRVRISVHGEPVTEFPLSDLVQPVDDSWLQ